MPRPITSAEQRLIAYSLYQQKIGPTAILKALRERFDKPVSPRTVANWVKVFKRVGEENATESTFEWHRMEEYGLPWDASALLLDIWANIQDGEGLPPPTVRQVRWWWRVHWAVPDIEGYDVWVFAQRFVYRELRHELLGEPLELADLEAHLAYKPWASEEQHQMYQRAITRQRIPPLRQDAIQTLQDPHVVRLLDQAAGRQVGIDSLVATLVTQRPELLPSKQLPLVREELGLAHQGETKG